KPPPAPVTLNLKILNQDDATLLDVNETLPGEAFAAEGSADYQLDLPLANLSRGPHLLSVTAPRPDGRNSRGDGVFRIRQQFRLLARWVRRSNRLIAGNVSQCAHEDDLHP